MKAVTILSSNCAHNKKASLFTFCSMAISCWFEGRCDARARNDEFCFGASRQRNRLLHYSRFKCQDCRLAPSGNYIIVITKMHCIMSRWTSMMRAQSFLCVVVTSSPKIQLFHTRGKTSSEGARTLMCDCRH